MRRRFTETLALRVAVPADGTDSSAGGAQRLHASASRARAAHLPGHLTALRPSPDASNRHDQRSGGVGIGHAQSGEASRRKTNALTAGRWPQTSRSSRMKSKHQAGVASRPLHHQRPGPRGGARSLQAPARPLTATPGHLHGFNAFAACTASNAIRKSARRTTRKSRALDHAASAMSRSVMCVSSMPQLCIGLSVRRSPTLCERVGKGIQ